MSPAPLTRSRATDTTPVPVRTETVHVGLIAIVLVWLLRRLAGAVAPTVRIPLLLAAVLMIIGLGVLRSWAGPWLTLAAILTLIGSLVGWRVWSPASFTLILGNRARSLGLAGSGRIDATGSRP